MFFFICETRARYHTPDAAESRTLFMPAARCRARCHAADGAETRRALFLFDARTSDHMNRHAFAAYAHYSLC